MAEYERRVPNQFPRPRSSRFGKVANANRVAHASAAYRPTENGANWHLRFRFGII